MTRRLHELDRCSIGVTNVDDSFTRVRTGRESLRRPGRFVAGFGDSFQHGVNIVDGERDMGGANVARPGIASSFTIRRSMIFKQFDLVPRRFHYGERNFGTWHSGYITGQLAGLMRPVRKFESKHIPPE